MKPLFRDHTQPIEARIEDLLRRMTTEEKVGQLVQLAGNRADIVEACAAGRCGSILCVVGEQVRAPQEAALASRLGIPLLAGIDAIHGHSMWPHATIFPSQLGLSCSWDAGLCERVARATAVEMAHTGVHWAFSPVLCLPRDLRWGRVNETFGEDAELIAGLGCAMIRGYQGADLAAPDSVAACAKHFVGYGDSEGGRDASDSGHSPRTLRALFYPPFEAAAKAGVATWMSAYHTVDGKPVAFDSKLLKDVLRGEWGADGVVVTDWDVIGRMHRDRRLCASLGEGAAKALRGGNDLFMSTPSFHEDTLANLKTGAVTLEQVEEACRRVLRLKFRLGLFENPRLPDEAKAISVSGTDAHRALALEAARKSLVLLKNRGVLPLRTDTVRRIAVIGPNADDVVNQLGDWSLGSGQGQGPRDAYPREATTTVLDGVLRRATAAGVTVEHAAGAGVPAPRYTGFPPRWERHETGNGVREPAPERVARAVRLAERSDVVVLVLGDQIAYIGESKSTATLELPGEQQALFDAVVATGTPVVVVLVTSKPLAIPEVAKRADAILCAHNPGMAGGAGVAEALFGDIDPCGRLTLSWPVHVGQQPVRYDQAPGAHQAGYPDLPGVGLDPLWAFGFGLSYTTVRYRSLKLAATALAPGEPLRAQVRVANTGLRPVEETVQVYLNDEYTSVAWPEKRLKAWRRVYLEPGEERTLDFELPHAALALCDEAGRRVVEPGSFQLMAGGSSRGCDLLRARFCVG